MGLMGSTVESRLRFLANASALLSLGALIFILRYKIDFDNFFPTRDALASWNSWRRLVRQEGSSLFLAACVVLWLLAWRRAYMRELMIGASLFSLARTPRDLTNVRAAELWPVLALAFNLSFLAMAWFVDNIFFFSILVSAIIIIDILSFWMTRTNLYKYLRDPKYAPAESDEHREFILRRRIIVEEYIFGQRHGLRIGSCALLALVACFVSAAREIGWASSPIVVAYVAIALAVFGNEAVLTRMRAVRDAKLATVDDDEAVADKSRLGEA